MLNGNYEGKLHGLALNVIGNGGYLRDLKKKVELETKDLIGAITSYKRLTMSHKLNDPYSFYHSHLKPWVRRFEKDQPYRTYFVKKMKNIEILDYRFAKGYKP